MAASAPSLLALSSARTTVVPTAITRPPSARVRRILSISAAPTLSHSRVHVMVFQIVLAHRLERAGADMQRDVTELDAALAQPLEHRLVEMQTRRRCRHGTRLARIHGLVAFRVTGIGLALDIRRQRHVAELEQQLFQRLGCFETQAEKFAITAQHHRMAAVSQLDRDRPLSASCSRRVAPCASCAPVTRSIRISTAPPVSLRPYRRAGSTRVSLNTSRSPATQELGQIAEHAVLARTLRPRRAAAGGWPSARPAAPARSVRAADRNRNRTSSRETRPACGNSPLSRSTPDPVRVLYSQPFCRASRYASMRLATPSLPIASER